MLLKQIYSDIYYIYLYNIIYIYTIYIIYQNKTEPLDEIHIFLCKYSFKIQFTIRITLYINYRLTLLLYVIAKNLLFALYASIFSFSSLFIFNIK